MYKNKRGVELTLETIVIFIIVVITLVVVIMFFAGEYSEGSNKLIETSNQVINSTANKTNN